MTDPAGGASRLDWVRGDNLGLDIPAHAAALRDGGVDFLTRAFRANHALGTGNRVARITEFQDCPGGSTGRKLLLAVEYERPDPALKTQLFVKFSRDFDDPIRDRGKDQMEGEVRFGLLSHSPDFPITVPECLFADYHHASGTGILITERVPFGVAPVEPQHEKAADYDVPDAIDYYRALVTANARLAGAHKAGRLHGDIDAQFPFDAEAFAAQDPIRYSLAQLESRVGRYGQFVQENARLLPANICKPAFVGRLAADIPLFLEHERTIKLALYRNRDFIALAHWNTNIDNAWFWRDEAGALHCGLIDWGRAGQMNVVLALWGGLSASEVDQWNTHFDDLMALFRDEYAAAGGPLLEVEEMKQQLCLFVALLTLSWLMDAPALIRRTVPDLAEVPDRFDDRFRHNELARTQLHMMSVVMNLWERQDFGARLAEFLRRA